MSVDFAGFTAQQLKSYAEGYTDARTETAMELAELHQRIAALDAELIQARQIADAIYHDAYCGCRKTIVADSIRAMEIAAYRAAHTRYP